MESNPMTFDTFMQTAWSDHGERPGDVADRLAASLGVIESAAHIPPFARLVAHVLGEHLGQWQRGIDLLGSLQKLPAFDGSDDVAGALARAIATLRYASGDCSALHAFGLEDRVSVLGAAASALAGRLEFKPAIAAYRAALQLAAEGLAPESAANRALAIGGNNLAAALEEKKDRDAAETEGMVVAAEGGLKYWKLAGTWLEEERAEYRLTRSLLQAGQVRAAIASAQRCLRVCERNDAPAFERFFGHAVLALAQRAAGDPGAFVASRARALELYAQVAGDERPWCRGELEELGAEADVVGPIRS